VVDVRCCAVRTALLLRNFQNYSEGCSVIATRRTVRAVRHSLRRRLSGTLVGLSLEDFPAKNPRQSGPEQWRRQRGFGDRKNHFAADPRTSEKPGSHRVLAVHRRGLEILWVPEQDSIPDCLARTAKMQHGLQPVKGSCMRLQRNPPRKSVL